MFEQLAEKYGVPVVPHFLEGVYGQDGYMQKDGVHPSMLAQSRMLGNLWPKLTTLLD
jgi:acyl-CoA thioesterase-1